MKYTPHSRMRRQISKTAFELYESEKENRSTENTRKKSIKQFESSKSCTNKQLYIAQLQSKVHELENTVEMQKIQIKSLSDQRNCMKLICEKQQAKISNISNVKDIEILKEEFNKEIQDLKNEKQKIIDVVCNLNYEHQKQLNQIKLTLDTTQAQNLHLRLQIDSIKQHEQQQSQQKIILQEQLQALRQEIYEKRNLQKKYRMAIKQLERYENECKTSTDTN